jgi:hypothetical protein
MAMQDDILTGAGAVPDPDAEPGPGELAHARRFAELIDKTLSGRTPPAIPADDRALLEVATVIRTTLGEASLADGRRRAVIDEALRQAVQSPMGSVPSVPAVPRSEPYATRPRARLMPWLATGASTLVAAAALAALWLRTPSSPRPATAPAAPLPAWRSRSADSLVGPIGRAEAAGAGARIDAIFADRLDGFRALRLAQRGEP